mgnify:CR=1 FL=1
MGLSVGSMAWAKPNAEPRNYGVVLEMSRLAISVQSAIRTASNELLVFKNNAISTPFTVAVERYVAFFIVVMHAASAGVGAIVVLTAELRVICWPG